MAIRAINLGKAYPAATGPWGTLAGWLGVRRRPPHWVFRGLDVRIGAGETVGLVGANGAGKSTFLKLVAGTSVPTEGRVEVEGSLAALLELGMGFHPEFTGRQNVFLAGQIMGLDRDRIAGLIPAIEAFAEIGDAFDHPVRRYSSGMFVRLAFSVATAVRPDVLIVDEALAVGDLYFQHKSYARIRGFMEQGTTVLFVSHDAVAVKSLCTRAILLGEGTVMMDGKPDDVLDYYVALTAEREDRAVLSTPGAAFDGRSGDGRARAESVTLTHADGPDKPLRSGDPAVVRVTFTVREPLQDLVVGFIIKDRTGADVYGTNTWQRVGIAELGDRPGLRRTVAFRIPCLSIAPGSYSVASALHSGANHLAENYDWWERAVIVQVLPNHRHGLFVGIAALDAAPVEEASAS